MDIVSELFNYIVRYETLTGRRPAAMPVTIGETNELDRIVKDKFMLAGMVLEDVPPEPVRVMWGVDLYPTYDARARRKQIKDLTMK